MLNFLPIIHYSVAQRHKAVKPVTFKTHNPSSSSQALYHQVSALHTNSSQTVRNYFAMVYTWVHINVNVYQDNGKENMNCSFNIQIYDASQNMKQNVQFLW